MVNFKKTFENFDKTDLKIMKNGIKICFVILLFSIFLLNVYMCSHGLFLYNLGIAILKLSTYFIVEFVVCGVVADKIKKQIE